MLYWLRVLEPRATFVKTVDTLGLGPIDFAARVRKHIRVCLAMSLNYSEQVDIVIDHTLWDLLTGSLVARFSSLYVFYSLLTLPCVTIYNMTIRASFFYSRSFVGWTPG